MFPQRLLKIHTDVRLGRIGRAPGQARSCAAAVPFAAASTGTSPSRAPDQSRRTGYIERGITLSDGEGHGERAPTRRYGRRADLWPDFFRGGRTGRSARTASLADARICRDECALPGVRTAITAGSPEIQSAGRGHGTLPWQRWFYVQFLITDGSSGAKSRLADHIRSSSVLSPGTFSRGITSLGRAWGAQ